MKEITEFIRQPLAYCMDSKIKKGMLNTSLSIILSENFTSCQ